MKIRIKDTELRLLPERAIWWRKRSALILADLHLGKVSHFRKNGIAVPLMAERNNLLRLSNLLTKFKPEHVYYLGDLFHSHRNRAWDEFSDFRKGYSQTKMTLIRGNHDILHPSNFREADLRVENKLKIGPFLLSHDREETGLYNLHGHIHPCVKLRGKGRQSIKTPCYFFSDCFGILPSFGDFTGSHPLKPKKSDRVYIPTEDEVFALT